MLVERLRVEDMFVISEAEVVFSPGIVLVDGVNRDRAVGSNQVGKSSLFDTLCLALFEENPKRVVKDSAVRVGSKGGRVEVLVNGKKVVYERFPASPRWYVVEGDGKVVELVWNQMGRYIRDNVLHGIGYKEFVLGNCFWQGAMSEFVQAGDAERKEMFVRWFGLDRYLRAREKVVERMKDVVSMLSEIDGRLKEVKGVEEEVRALKEELSRVTAAVGAGVEGVEEELVEFVKRNSHRVVEERLYREQRKVLLEKVRKVKEAQRLYDVVVQLEDKITALTSELRVVQERLRYVREGRCFVCGSQVSEEFCAGLERREEELRSLLTQVRQVLDKVSWSKGFVGRGEEVVKEFKRLRERVDWGGKVREARRVIDKLSELKRKEQQLVYRIEELNRERERLEVELRLCKIWKDGFSDDGVILYAISECFKLLNRYLDGYASLFGFRPRCVVKKGRVVVEVEDGFRSATNVDGFSASEKYLISLVVLFGMRDFLSSFGKVSNLLILDEVFAVFDKEWRQRLVAIINKRKDVVGAETIVVVTHHEDVKMELDYHTLWWFERKGGTSYLTVHSR